MCNSNRFVNFLFFCMSVFSFTHAAMIKPNPILSRGTGVTVKVSSGDATGLNDNKFGPYDNKKWTVSDNSWIALQLASGPKKVFFTFNCPDTSWSDSIGLSADSCTKTVQYPVDYEIKTSANSTTGADGDWTQAVTVTGNSVTARGHLIDFDGMTWVKMEITKGNGKIDEVEAFDATNGAEDTWFFLGTKFTALMLKGSKASGYASDKSPPDSTFASMVNLRNPTFTPAMIRGGVNCRVTTGDVVRDISKYFAVAGNVHFWAIELGTFDAWGGGTDNVASFKTNLQIIIDSCKAHGIQPVIARIPATKSKAGWQVHADFLTAVDDLTKTNELIAGADLKAYFSTTLGAYDLDDKGGVLPNDYGNFEAQREWVKKMDTVVYKAPPMAVTTRPAAFNQASHFTVLSKNGRLVLDAGLPGTVTQFATDGRTIRKMQLSEAGGFPLGSAPGCFLVRFKSVKGVETVRVVNY